MEVPGGSSHARKPVTVQTVSALQRPPTASLPGVTSRSRPPLTSQHMLDGPALRRRHPPGRCDPASGHGLDSDARAPALACLGRGARRGRRWRAPGLRHECRLPCPPRRRRPHAADHYRCCMRATLWRRTSAGSRPPSARERGGSPKEG